MKKHLKIGQNFTLKKRQKGTGKTKKKNKKCSFYFKKKKQNYKGKENKNQIVF